MKKIDFNEIITMQKALDKSILTKKGFEYKEVKQQLLIALYVELGEFANELQSFKYWKEKKNIDRKKMLEEYVDCIHFFASFLGHKEPKGHDHTYAPKIFGQTTDINKQLMTTFYKLGNIREGFDWEDATVLPPNLYNHCFEYPFKLFLGVGELLGFDWEEVKQAYKDKNAVNYERLKNGY